MKKGKSQRILRVFAQMFDDLIMEGKMPSGKEALAKAAGTLPEI